MAKNLLLFNLTTTLAVRGGDEGEGVYLRAVGQSCYYKRMLRKILFFSNPRDVFLYHSHVIFQRVLQCRLETLLEMELSILNTIQLCYTLQLVLVHFLQIACHHAFPIIQVSS